MPYLCSEAICQLRYNSLLIYYKPQYSLNSSAFYKRQKSQNFKEAKTYSGTITLHTKKRISKAINIMLQALPKQRIFNPITNKYEMFKINFLTLTISANERHLSANEAYTLLLRPFLQWLVKTMGVKLYIWKAEITKKGQIHYHITTDTWIHHSYLRNKWNYLLAKNNLLDEYRKKYGHTNANSIDIHKVYKERDMAGYMHKELCKTLQNQHATKGKIWDCASSLKGEAYYSVVFDVTHEKRLYDILRKSNLTEINTDQFILIKGNKQISKDMLTKDEREQYAKWIMQIRNAPHLEFG